MPRSLPSTPGLDKGARVRYSHGVSNHDLAKLVRAARLEDDLWALVGAPSPTGNEGPAAAVFAQLLADAGADVSWDRTWPSSPSVIGRWSTGRPGPTLQLSGHLDHIDVPHGKPERRAGSITGRGAADMKNGLAAALSVLRILREQREGLCGGVLVTAYGLHEAPTGTGQGLRSLIDQGILGDAALVMEGPPGVVVAGKGQSIWRVVLRREGPPCHEMDRPAGADALLGTAADLATRLQRENGALAARGGGHPTLGPDTVFVGQLHYGDFYNRSPGVCFLEGTMRWNPGASLADAQARLARILDELPKTPGVTAEAGWTFVGDAYAVDTGCELARSLRAAHAELGLPVPPDSGTRVVLDTNLLAGRGRIPALPIDCDGATRHSDLEVVRTDALVAACRLALLTSARYLARP